MNTEFVTTGEVGAERRRMNDLAILKHAQQALDKAHSIREVKDVRDQAEVVRAYVRRQGYGLDYQNKGAEIKILAECRLGELLGKIPKHPGGRPPENRSHDGTGFSSLAEQGITKNDSHRWQRMAGVPVAERDAKIEELKAKKKELTSAAILAMAKQNDFDALAVEGNIEKGQQFRTIYADPPWAYSNQATRSAASCNYPTMTLQEICDLKPFDIPVRDLALEKAHLFLWTTNAFLRSAFEVIEAWGFEYKSVFVWCKEQIGIGNYFRVSTEFLLLGVRGLLRFQVKDQRNWIATDISRSKIRHSQKPDAVRAVVERCGYKPRLELFARRTAEGWTSWGNQVEKMLTPATPSLVQGCGSAVTGSRTGTEGFRPGAARRRRQVCFSTGVAEYAAFPERRRTPFVKPGVFKVQSQEDAATGG